MNKRFTKYISFFIVAFLVLTMISCRSPKSIIKASIKEQGSEYLFTQLKKNELKYEWLTAKVNIEYIEEDKKTNFVAQIRLRKDSVIWMSFSPALGIEVARLMITNDSVKFINRVNKTYFLGDYKFVNDFLKTNIDFDVFQSFLTGNDFQFYEKAKFKASVDNHQYKLATTSRHKLKEFIKKSDENPVVFIQNIWLDPENFKITVVKIKEIEKENKKLEAYYNNFKLIDKQLFPIDIAFKVSAEIDIFIDINFSKIVLNKSDLGDKKLIEDIAKKYQTEIIAEIPYSKKILEAYSKGQPIENENINKIAKFLEELK